MENNTKIKVAYIGLTLDTVRFVGRFEIHGIPNIELDGYLKSLRSFLKDGFSAISYSRSLLYAYHIDELYRNRDSQYMRKISEFVEVLLKFDIIIFSTFCPIHPEILINKLQKPIKVLGFTDDPHSTYTRGIPFLWAFDAAYYISPSYSPLMGFEELMANVGFPKSRWLPLVQPVDYPRLRVEDIEDRSIKVAYVGCPTGTKVDRLRELNAVFGSDLALYGRWKFRGYYGFIRPLLGEKIFPRKVKAISSSEKDQLYRNTAIGFNMHVSDTSRECGNMRTYEAAGYGMMLLCDRAGLNLQRQIFAEGTEAIYYDNINHAIEIINYYIAHPEERIAIAWAAHQKFHDHYRWEKVTEDFLLWVIGNDQA